MDSSFVTFTTAGGSELRIRPAVVVAVQEVSHASGQHTCRLHLFGSNREPFEVVGTAAAVQSKLEE